MGPGPSNVSPRVMRAMTAPVVGHLDPYFFEVMDENQRGLRRLFNTQNELTFPISGTGTAGMETALVNLLESGDEIIVGIIGYFGARIAEMAERLGAVVHRIDPPWGQIVEPEQIESALERTDAKVVALIHAETSTGVEQPLREIGELVRAHDALFVVDTVCSLGGVPVEVDANHIDFSFSGSQKCLSAPPGLAPITVGERALRKIVSRRTPVGSFYLDLVLLERYWGEQRLYHHTTPITMNYALHEALQLIEAEGLEARFERHRRVSRLLREGLEDLGFRLFAPEGYRLPPLTTALLPDGVDDLRVRKALLERYHLEVGGGLGTLAGKVWRIGLMGHTAQERNVSYALAAIEAVIRK